MRIKVNSGTGGGRFGSELALALLVPWMLERFLSTSLSGMTAEGGSTDPEELSIVAQLHPLDRHGQDKSPWMAK